MSEQVGPAANVETRKRVIDSQKERDRRLASDTLTVVSSPHGRRFLAWLVDIQCDLFGRQSFVESPRLSAHLEGRRYVGEHIRAAAIKANPEHWYAIEEAMLASRIDPTNKPKESEDE